MSDTYAEYAHRNYEQEAKRFLANLERMAEEITRALAGSELPVLPTDPAHTRHQAAVSRAMHAFQWGIANAGFDGVIRAATEADYAERVDE